MRAKVENQARFEVEEFLNNNSNELFFSQMIDESNLIGADGLVVDNLDNLDNRDFEFISR